MFDDDKLYLAGDPALLVFGRPSTLAHWSRPSRPATRLPRPPPRDGSVFHRTAAIDQTPRP